MNRTERLKDYEGRRTDTVLPRHLPVPKGCMDIQQCAYPTEREPL